MPDNLKKGWTRVAFGDVVRQVRNRVDPGDTDLKRYVAGEHMDTDDLRIRRWGLIGDGYLGPAFHMSFKPGHVLYGSRRTYLRKVALADFEGITANTTFVLESRDPKLLLPELLPFIMQAEYFHEHSIKQSKGSVNPYINFSDLTWYEFALPPLEEQRRIAEVLNKFQIVLDSTLMTKTIANNLLESERENIFANSKPMRKPLGEIASVRYGLGQPPAVASNGVPMIRATNIDRGRILDHDMLRIDVNAVPDSRQAFLKDGDILIVRSGAYTGDSALITKDWVGSVAGYDLVITPDTTKIYPHYLAQFLLARHTVVRILRALSARTAQPHLNAADVTGISVPCPDMPSQEKAVEEMNRVQSCIDSLEMRINEVKLLKSKAMTLLRGEQTL